jgi:ADP-heptose:LPS heptosyltransferase
MTSPSSPPLIPSRILIVKPDNYGDILLLEPLLRALLQESAVCKVGLILRQEVVDVVPLLPPGLEIFGVELNPYAVSPSSGGVEEALDRLRLRLLAFAPDCVVGACFSKTWLECLVASWFPHAATVSLGRPQFGVVDQLALERGQPVVQLDSFRTLLHVDSSLQEWRKNVLLVEHLLHRSLTLHEPELRISDECAEQGRSVLTSLHLGPRTYIACCPTGSRSFPQRLWPARNYAAVLSSLLAETGLDVLLLGHESEKDILDEVVGSTHVPEGRRLRCWAGRAGEYPILAALLQSARMYVGGDTSAVHIASALKLPGIAVYGGGTWPRFKPAFQGIVAIVQPLPCFGCDWICTFGNAPCIQNIPASRVSEVALSVYHRLQSARTIEVPASLTAEQIRKAELWKSVGATYRKERAAAESLLRSLEAAEKDRVARLDVIVRQGGEIGALKSEIAKLQSELEQNSLLRSTNDATIQQLQSQLAACEKDRADRLDVINNQGARTSELEAIIHQQVGELARLTEEKLADQEAIGRRATEQVAQLERQLGERTEKVERLEEQLAARGEQIGQLERQLGARSDQVTELQASLAVERSGRETMLKELQVMSEVRQVLQGEMEMLRSALELERGRMRDLRAHLSAWQSASRLHLFLYRRPASVTLPKKQRPS